MKVLLIDERDCFTPIKESVSQNTEVSILEPEYFQAPNPDFLQRMIDASKDTELVILHRAIWVDECESTENCVGINTYENAIKPTPVLRVGKDKTDHNSCPQELLKVFNQITNGYKKLGKIIGAKVKPPSNRWSCSYLTIKGLTIIGDNEVGCTLETPDNYREIKYFKLHELELFEQF